MSAKDELERFDSEWDSHVRGKARLAAGADYYFDSDRRRVNSLPASLEYEFLANAEALIARAVAQLYASRRAKLVRAAVEEAEATLQLLRDGAPHGVAPISTEEPLGFPEWPDP